MTQKDAGAARSEVLQMVAEVISNYLKKNPVTAAELPGVIRSVYSALTGSETAPAPVGDGRPEPAVPIKKSVFPDYIVCLEDGKKLKMLKRHLATAYGLTPDEYRQRWGLAADYPMVAPSYAAQRSSLAKQIGLGSRARTAPKRVRGRGRGRKGEAA